MTTNLLSKVDPEIDRAFTKYISLHQKSFLTKEEFRARLANFKKSYELMKQHNLDSSQSYKMGLNKFSDWSDQELNSMLQFKEPLDSDEDSTGPEEVAPNLKSNGLLGAPASVDWRN